MKKIFGLSEEKMAESSASFTLEEISQQPATWGKTCKQIEALKGEIARFMDPVLNSGDPDIILTGAGTSEFVGNTLFPHLSGLYGHRVRSCGTTDLVAVPEAYLSRTRPTLLVSFARSGNSPESLGAVEAAETVCGRLHHMFITCNKDGALSKRSADAGSCYVINLAEETNDRAFAMTSSFTNMYLAAYLCFHKDDLSESVRDTGEIGLAGQAFLDGEYGSVQRIVDDFTFDRIVYLGSGALKGIAQESALKMLELTAGQVVALYDTPLGFRHGPKSVINDRTLTVVYLSGNPYTRQYEIDLIREMAGQRRGNRIAAVMSKDDGRISSLADHTVRFRTAAEHDDALLALDYVLFGQTLAVLKSLALGVTPDDPCPTGEVNRVVKGVTIYPYTPLRP